MDCPHCQTPNPATAVRCQKCDAPIDLNTPTFIDSEVGKGGDENLTLENWSAAITAPSEREASSSTKQIQRGSLLAMRYELLGGVGGGGRGTVYKAKDREVNRFVAVKVIREDLAGDSAMLS